MVSAEAAHALQTKENRSAWPAWVFLSRVRVKPEGPRSSYQGRVPNFQVSDTKDFQVPISTERYSFSVLLSSLFFKGIKQF